MKDKSHGLTRNAVGRLVQMAGLVLMVAVMFLALPASGQLTQPNTFKLMTNVPVEMAANSQSNITSYVTANPGHGLGVMISMDCTNAATGTLITWWEVSVDGTNFTTTRQFLVTATAAGTNALNILTNRVTYFTNIPATILNNYRVLKLAGVTNASATFVPRLRVWTSKNNY